MASEPIQVAAALLRDIEGRVLVSQRRIRPLVSLRHDDPDPPLGGVVPGDWARARAAGVFGVAGVRAFGWT